MEKNVFCMKNCIEHYINAISNQPLNMHMIINYLYSISLSHEEITIKNLNLQTKKRVNYFIEHEAINESMALFGGLTELGLALWNINRKEKSYVLEIMKINELLLRRIKMFLEEIHSKKRSIMGNFDVISGLSGIVNYCMLYSDKFKNQIEEIILLFIRETLSDSMWKIVPYSLDERDNRKLKEEYYDLGAAHGMIGPLVIMVKAYAMGYKIQYLDDAIKKIIYLYFKYIDYDTYSIPCIVSEKEDRYDICERDTWSYGTTTMLLALLKATKIIKDKRYEDVEYLLLERVKKNLMVSEPLFISPTLLNGYSGLLCVLEQCYVETNHLLIKRLIDYIRIHVKEKYDSNSKYGYKHYEYVYSHKRGWSVNTYDLDGFAYGTVGVLLALENKMIVKEHLLL